MKLTNDVLDDCAERILMQVPKEVRDLLRALTQEHSLRLWQVVAGVIVDNEATGRLSAFSIDPAWNQGLLQENSVCEFCGKEFTPKRINQPFCSNHCGQAADKGLEHIPDDIKEYVESKPIEEKGDEPVVEPPKEKPVEETKTVPLDKEKIKKAIEHEKSQAPLKLRGDNNDGPKSKPVDSSKSNKPSKPKLDRWGGGLMAALGSEKESSSGTDELNRIDSLAGVPGADDKADSKTSGRPRTGPTPRNISDSRGKGKGSTKK